MIKQLIFDCDGVLVDSEIIAAQVMVELLEKSGIIITLEYYLHNCTGKTFSGLKKELSEQFTTPLPDDFLYEVTTLMDKKARTDLKPIPNIHRVLEQSKLPKAVVSNSDVYQIKHAINHINIAHHFSDNIFSSQMVKLPKPDPGIYLLAAEKLEVETENCLVVEDSISGATAAVQAGMQVIGFTAGTHIINGHKEKLMDTGVSQVAGTAEELHRLITFLTD